MDEFSNQDLRKAWKAALPKERRQLIVSAFTDAHSVFIDRGDPTQPTPKRLLIHAYRHMCNMLRFLEECPSSDNLRQMAA